MLVSSLNKNTVKAKYHTKYLAILNRNKVKLKNSNSRSFLDCKSLIFLIDWSAFKCKKYITPAKKSLVIKVSG